MRRDATTRRRIRSLKYFQYLTLNILLSLRLRLTQLDIVQRETPLPVPRCHLPVLDLGSRGLCCLNFTREGT